MLLTINESHLVLGYKVKVLIDGVGVFYLILNCGLYYNQKSSDPNYDARYWSGHLLSPSGGLLQHSHQMTGAVDGFGWESALT